MQFWREDTGQEIILVENAPLFGGGEGLIYAVAGQPTLVAKVFHKPTAELADKLQAMLVQPPKDPSAALQHRSIAWPVARLRDAQGRCCGYLMPRLDNARVMHDIANPGLRLQLCPQFHYGYLVRTGHNLAAGVRALHEWGYVVGDMSGTNFLVTPRALVTLVDTDSFQVPRKGGFYRCRVGTAEYTPPEMQGQSFPEVDRGPENDAFGLGVLVFQLLMQGIHPFAGRYTGVGEPGSIGPRIRAGHWPYARSRAVPYVPNPHAPPWEALPGPVQELLQRCFDEGHEAPELRPGALAWQQALAESEELLLPCSRNRQHWYHWVLQENCPWCELAQRQGRDPFPAAGEDRPESGWKGAASTKGAEVLVVSRRSWKNSLPAGLQGRAISWAAWWAKVLGGWSGFRGLGRSRFRQLVPLLVGGAVLGLLWVILVFLFAFFIPSKNQHKISQEKASTELIASGIFQGPPVPEGEQTTKTSPPISSPPPPPRPTPKVDHTNSIAMQFVRISPGNFLMGSPVGEGYRNFEETQHPVTLTKEFYLGIYEVTQAQWQAVMGSNPSHSKGDDLPVENVSWDDCQDFCQKLKAREGKRYRLPTEAEWEYACRAGTDTVYGYGDDADQLGEHAWYLNNSSGKTHPVGQKWPNRWGLYDMHGNVSELCQDGYNFGGHPQSDQVDPIIPPLGAYRVYRGGSFESFPPFCRSADRKRSSHKLRSPDLGCRLALDLTGNKEEKPQVVEKPEKPRSEDKPKLVEKPKVETPDPAFPINPSPGQVWTNRRSMKFAWIPPGNFGMGSSSSEKVINPTETRGGGSSRTRLVRPPSDKGQSPNETQHPVRLTRGFYLGVYEVTQAQWQAIMGSNPSSFQGDDYPVEQVSWNDCQDFCRKLSVREGKRYRLPTEAEWEFACRAGTGTPYSFGTDAGQLGEHAWHRNNSSYKTHPVGQKLANRWGLYDMHGNLCEWCQDHYGNYPRSSQVDPAGPSQGLFRVFRGGSWRDDRQHCRSAARGGSEPEGAYNTVGLRLALYPNEPFQPESGDTGEVEP